MQIETWLLYFTTIIIVIAIPGPLSLLMVNSTLKLGVRASAPVIFGGSFASSILLIVSASGLGADRTHPRQGEEEASTRWEAVREGRQEQRPTGKRSRRTA